ncbi:hypothetical protein [Cetobacterium sp.]
MKKFSENQRKQNLLNVKSCYFASYTTYDDNGNAELQVGLLLNTLKIV